MELYNLDDAGDDELTGDEEAEQLCQSIDANDGPDAGALVHDADRSIDAGGSPDKAKTTISLFIKTVAKLVQAELVAAVKADTVRRYFTEGTVSDIDCERLAHIINFFRRYYAGNVGPSHSPCNFVLHAPFVRLAQYVHVVFGIPYRKRVVPHHSLGKLLPVVIKAETLYEIFMIKRRVGLPVERYGIPSIPSAKIAHGNPAAMFDAIFKRIPFHGDKSGSKRYRDTEFAHRFAHSISLTVFVA